LGARQWRNSKRILASYSGDALAKLAEDELRRSPEARKLYAAETFATEGGLTQAVNRVDDAVKKLTDRMDRYFENRWYLYLCPQPASKTIEPRGVGVADYRARNFERGLPKEINGLSRQ
jgi:hypothetical protein